jgi:hypothetical protein
MGGEDGVPRVRRFREHYGAGPVHLLALLASLAICAYGLSRVLDQLPKPANFAIWFGGAIVAHDLVLYPLYSLLGLVAYGVLARPTPRDRLRVAALNHLRLPALMSALLLLVWLPLVAGLGETTFARASGLRSDVYLQRWLLISAALFAGSALLFALRVRLLADRR